MNRVDLNRPIWGYKAITHFYIHSALRAAISLTLLGSILDYVNLSSDASSEVKNILLTKFLIFMPAYFLVGCFYLMFTLCPNKIWYGICMAFEATRICCSLLITTFNLLSYGLTQTNVDKERDVLKFYPCGLVGKVIIDYGTILFGIYFCLLLLELSFLYVPPKPSSDLYVVRVTSPGAEQSTDIAIDRSGNSIISRAKSPTNLDTEEEANEDDRGKSKSLKSAKCQKTGKSRRSQKSKKSEKSLKFQKTQEDSGKSKTVNSSKSKRSKSSKSSKSLESVTENSGEEGVMQVAV